jgi:4a-hydroxytetrahydrobiopterin dehydratase
MPEAPVLSPERLTAELAGLAEWGVTDGSLSATYLMESFPQGIELVRRAATSAEAAAHHPDIDIRWRSITFRLTTHDSGGITMRDVSLARRIQGHARTLGWVLP